jgi:hypothetical protein
MEGAAMILIDMNPDKLSIRAGDSETTGFLYTYSCVHRPYPIPASQPNTAIPTNIPCQYDPKIPNIYDLFLDFVDNISHSIRQVKTQNN